MKQVVWMITLLVAPMSSPVVRFTFREMNFDVMAVEWSEVLQSATQNIFLNEIVPRYVFRNNQLSSSMIQLKSSYWKELSIEREEKNN